MYLLAPETCFGLFHQISFAEVNIFIKNRIQTALTFVYYWTSVQADLYQLLDTFVYFKHQPGRFISIIRYFCTFIHFEYQSRKIYINYKILLYLCKLWTSAQEDLYRLLDTFVPLYILNISPGRFISIIRYFCTFVYFEHPPRNIYTNY